LSSGWKVWLKTENLALVGGNPHYFSLSFDLVSFCFSCDFQDNVCRSSLGGMFSCSVPSLQHPLRYCISRHIEDNVSF
jgi:hypothetical protein